MAKKKGSEPKEEEDIFEQDESYLEREEGIVKEEDFFVFDDEYEPEMDFETQEREEDYSTAKPNSSSPCLRSGYCTKCEGELSEPEGSCRCRCHDLA